MEIKMIDTIFKSDIKKKFDGKWISIGKVDSTYLKIDDEYVINPLTGNPYIVPVGYNPESTINRFVEYDQKNSVFQNLYQYKTSGFLIYKEDSMVKNLVGLLMIIKQSLLSISA